MRPFPEDVRCGSAPSATMRINLRSLRDSGITWEALAGTSVDRISVESRARTHLDDDAVRAATVCKRRDWARGTGVG